MKSPTDVEILSFIRDHYYGVFASFDKDHPTRLTKIYVPIDVDMIGEKFEVDGDIIFGRLHYDLNRKYGYKNDDGSKVEFFANGLGSGNTREKHLIHFPLLDAVIKQLESGQSPRVEKPLFYAILHALHEKQDTGKFHNLFELFPNSEKAVIREKARELQMQGLVKLASLGFSSTAFLDSEPILPTNPKVEKLQRLKYENELNAKITLPGIQYFQNNTSAVTTTVTNIDQSTHQQITGNQIHGSVNQSSDSSNNKPKEESSGNRKSLLKTASIIIGIIASVTTIILFIDWLLKLK